MEEIVKTESVRSESKSALSLEQITHLNSLSFDESSPDLDEEVTDDAIRHKFILLRIKARHMDFNKAPYFENVKRRIVENGIRVLHCFRVRRDKNPETLGKLLKTILFKLFGEKLVFYGHLGQTIEPSVFSDAFITKGFSNLVACAVLAEHEVRFILRRVKLLVLQVDPEILASAERLRFIESIETLFPLAIREHAYRNLLYPLHG